MARHSKKTRKDASATAPSMPHPATSSSGPRAASGADADTGSDSNLVSAEDSGKSSLAPGLYITATPIGNASDITLRALKVLSQCDAIVAEDSRVTSRLLAIHGISRPLLVYNDHNAPGVRPKLIARLQSGARLALVSDAGTPLISDPGHKLVRAAREAGVGVYPVPGASAALAALCAAGLPNDRFLFAGFLPAKSGERRAALNELKTVPATLIFYESPRRLAETIAEMAVILGPRSAVVARELTKLHEEFREGPLDRLAADYAGEETPKGEVTLVVAPPTEAVIDRTRIDSMLRQALPFMPLKAAAGLIAEATGAPRREIYDRGLELQAEGPDGPES